MSLITQDFSHFNLADNTHVDPRRTQVIDAGDRRQLLVDDFLLALGRRHDEYPRNLRWSVGPVVKHGRPLLQGQDPWERSSAWVNVLRDSGCYRMWYNASRTDPCQENRQRLFVSYAESDDGLDFRRRGPAPEDAVVFDGGPGGVSAELGGVFIDPSAEPAERFKLVYSDWQSNAVWHTPFTHNVGMLRGAASPDGLAWRRYWDNFTGKYCDSQNVAGWDPTLSRYVAYVRDTGRYGGVAAGAYQVESDRRGRAVARLESPDFRNWERTGIALQGDFEDGLNTDVYNSGYSPYPLADHLYFMFPSFYRHHEGTFDVQVCTSRDNRNWFRASRETFIPLGQERAFDCFTISVAPGFVQVDDDTLALYYRSGDGPHGGSRPITLDYTPASRVSRVTFKRDRIVGIQAVGGEAQFTTRPLRVAAGGLTVNVERTGADPWLSAQLLGADGAPVPGHTFAECRPVTGDGLDAPVIWTGGRPLPAEVLQAGVRLHVQYRDLRFYAFQFGGAR